MKIKTFIQRFVLVAMLLVGTLTAFAQQVQVTGVVSDPTGEFYSRSLRGIEKCRGTVWG